MWKKINVLILVAVAGVLFPVQGQDAQLKALVEKALEQNYGVRIARVEQQIAERENTLGNAGFMPRIYFDADQQLQIRDSDQEFVSGETQEIEGGQSQTLAAGFGLEWTVFDGFKMFAERDRLQKLAMRGKINTRYYMEQTVQDLALVYYQLVQGRALLEEYRLTVEVSRERLKLEEKRDKVGSGSALEVKRAQINLNADSMRVVEHLAQLRNFEFEINRLMGTDILDEISTSSEFNLDLNADPQTALDKAKESNSELNIAQLEQLIEEQNVKIQRGNFMPEVSVFGQYNYNRSTSDFGFLLRNRQLGPAVGVQLRFNLYDGGQERMAMDNARLREKNAGITVEEKEKEIEAAVRTAEENYRRAKERLVLAKDNMVQAKELQIIADEQYEIGSITSLEYRQVQLEVLQAKTAKIQAEFAVKENEIKLSRLAGNIVEKVL